MEFRYINVPRNTQRESPSENNRIAKYRCNEHIYEVSDVLLNTYSVSEIIFILTAGVDRVPKKKKRHTYIWTNESTVPTKHVKHGRVWRYCISAAVFRRIYYAIVTWHLEYYYWLFLCSYEKKKDIFCIEISILFDYIN